LLLTRAIEVSFAAAQGFIDFREVVLAREQREVDELLHGGEVELKN
jgi:hypothetical protein